MQLAPVWTKVTAKHIGKGDDCSDGEAAEDDAADADSSNLEARPVTESGGGGAAVPLALGGAVIVYGASQDEAECGREEQDIDEEASTDC